MRKIFHNALSVMTDAFQKLESRIAPPEGVLHQGILVYRYSNKGIEQALIQKLARYISGLNAIDILLLHGFTQEQGVLQRTLDEIHEDIVFLAIALTNDEITDSHKKYLDAFYLESVLPDDTGQQTIKKPNLLPRRKIRSYTARALNFNSDESGETVHTIYSGYIHSASPNIMDMYCGHPAQFRINGMLGTAVMHGYIDDSWNYFYRGLLSTLAVSKAFGDSKLRDVLFEYLSEFEKTSNTNYMGKVKSEAGQV